MKLVACKRGETLVDVLQVIAMGVFFMLPFALLKLWWWVYFFGAVMLVLGVFEIVSKVRTGKTLSQQFWDSYRRKGKCAKKKAILTLISLCIGWTILIWHLGMKL